jgi:hypothetical protein
LTAVAFTPDGKWLTTTDLVGNLSLWNLATGERKTWPLVPPVWRGTLAPDGRHVAVTNGNGTVYVIRLWPTPRP